MGDAVSFRLQPSVCGCRGPSGLVGCQNSPRSLGSDQKGPSTWLGLASTWAVKCPASFLKTLLNVKKTKKHWLFRERQKPLLLTRSLVLKQLDTAWHLSGYSTSLSKTRTWDLKEGPTLPARRIRFGSVRSTCDVFIFLQNITIPSRRQKFAVRGSMQKILLHSVTQILALKKEMGYYEPLGCSRVPCNQKAAYSAVLLDNTHCPPAKKMIRNNPTSLSAENVTVHSEAAQLVHMRENNHCHDAMACLEHFTLPTCDPGRSFMRERSKQGRA